MTELFELQANSLSPHRQCLDARFINFVADTVTCRRLDRALARNGDRRLDNVVPVALRSRDVAEQGEPGSVDIAILCALPIPTRASAATLVCRGRARRLNQASFTVSTNSSELDVDDSA